MLLDLLPSCVYTVAADLCLQPCRKKPLLKTNGITFQWSYCQALESKATFYNFTQFKPPAFAACPAGLLKLYIYCIIFINTTLKSCIPDSRDASRSLPHCNRRFCVRTMNCRICHNIFRFVLIVAFADEKLLAALKSIFCLRISKLSATGILFILN